MLSNSPLALALYLLSPLPEKLTVSAYWNQEEDNMVQYFWPNEKKKDRNNCKMYCIITAVGLFL